MITESLDRLDRLTKSVKSWPSRKGKTNLLDHLSGKTLTRSQAITAMCYSCTAGEKEICTAIGCPLYQFSQYSQYRCKIRSKLDTDSDLNWTVIPEKIGHSFRY